MHRSPTSIIYRQHCVVRQKHRIIAGNPIVCPLYDDSAAMLNAWHYTRPCDAFHSDILQMLFFDQVVFNVIQKLWICF